MTSRRVPHPTVIHFSIDGRKGILQAADIVAAFHLPTAPANLANYRLWPHPSSSEMVCVISKDITAGSILFRKQLLPSMLLIVGVSNVLGWVKRLWVKRVTGEKHVNPYTTRLING